MDLCTGALYIFVTFSIHICFVLFNFLIYLAVHNCFHIMFKSQNSVFINTLEYGYEIMLVSVEYDVCVKKMDKILIF